MRAKLKFLIALSSGLIITNLAVLGNDVILAPAKSPETIELVTGSPAKPNPGAYRLRDVKKIFVGSLGNNEGSELIRQKIINRLVQTGTVSVTESLESADAALTGIGQLFRRFSFNAYGGRTRESASIAIHLVGREGQILWVTESRSSVLAFPSVTSNVADKVVKDLVNAISQDRQLSALSGTH